MGIQGFSEDTFMVTLMRAPHMGDEIQKAIDMAHSCGGRNVIIDFSQAEILTSESINHLVVLEGMLGSVGRRLVLCAVPAQIMEIFRRTGLEALFEFAENELDAMRILRSNFYVCD